MISTHCDTTRILKKAEQGASIRMKYLIYPFEGAGKKLDDYKKLADDFNRLGYL